MENILTYKLLTLVQKSMGKNATLFHRFHLALLRNIVLVALTAALLVGSIVISHYQSTAHASYSGHTCAWHRVNWGDTVGNIARSYHTTIRTIARANNLRNVNLIYVGQRLCIPSSAHAAYRESGVSSDGSVRWYAYNALERSSPAQVAQLLRQAAARYHLPSSLLLAVAWQESGWNQHVIARDGGIGTMQVMPFTASGLNRAARTHLDPYKLWDNICLGAMYLHTLWINFHGDTTRVISAYNEGGWNVVHRGIFNWRYVRNVQALMRRFR